ncbi:PucR family transcriptional regulator [Streptomonospora sp. PA3]|uniref:PucR family transcriptional regulator n=1 Tax=Streptomonospora sp. PA3 TaxID=2607326 RepID=UPI0012DC4786|nr:PucR family transcriptional regulator [Streptomonospora sp. PA3]MUL40255.1 PucR family transcriptional regulator [Streptomonospora sp. PA3]
MRLETAHGTGSPGPRGREPAEAADLRDMQRAAGGADGVRRLLRWLGRRFDAEAALVDADGLVRRAFPAEASGLPWSSFAPVAGDASTLRRPGQGVRAVLERRTRSAVLESRPHEIHVVAVNDDRPGPALLVTVRGRLPAGASTLLIDAAGLLGLCWQAEEAERRQRALATADSRAREAVVQLLIVGAADGASRVAEVLTPSLPERVRVMIVDSPPERRKEVFQRCLTESGGTAWVYRCRVYKRHTIVIAPGGDGPAAPSSLSGVLRSLVRETADIRIGESPGVALGDVGIAYERAFHAVATQPGAERHSVFDPREELSLVLGERAHPWARALLGPLLDYIPERRQDPGSGDLLVTLRAWLDFRSRAGRQLNLHRNTVNARLRRIEALLGVHLGDLGTATRLHVALRVLAEHRTRPFDAGAAAPPDLAALLDTAPVRRWADDLLAPVRSEATAHLEPTLRTWLACDGNLDTAAAALGVSVTGVRKRLLKLEKAFGRSLLNGPSARYDLVIAMHVAARARERA